MLAEREGSRRCERDKVDSIGQWGLEHMCGQISTNRGEKMKVCYGPILINSYNRYDDSHCFLPACWSLSQPHINTALKEVSGWVSYLQPTLMKTLPRESWKGQEERIDLKAKAFWTNPVFSTVWQVKREKKPQPWLSLTFNPAIS